VFRSFIARVAIRAIYVDRVNISTYVLAGPLLWAIALATFAYTLDGKRRPFWQAAVQAFAIGAAVWAATFVLDGFVTPIYARALSSGVDPAIGAMMYTSFQTNQQAVARLGAVSWFAISFGTAIVGVLFMSRFREAPKSAVVGAIGAALGVWGIIACLSGEFAPAPFTSHYWTLTALAEGLWFAALGVMMMTARLNDEQAAALPNPTTAPGWRTALLEGKEVLLRWSRYG
jgi:hypothetical protein